MKITNLKIFEIFTKEYRIETEYREFMKNNIDKMKLKSNNYDVDERINKLKKM